MTIDRQRNWQDECDQLRKMASGIRAFLGGKGKLFLGGEWIEPETLAVQIDAQADSINRIIKMDIDLSDLTRKVKAAEPVRRRLRTIVHGLAQAATGAAPSAQVQGGGPAASGKPSTASVNMAAFGFRDPKVAAPYTGEQKVAMNKKRQATRKALNTRGSRQKKAAVDAIHEQQVVDAARSEQAAAGAASPSESASPASEGGSGPSGPPKTS